MRRYEVNAYHWQENQIEHSEDCRMSADVSIVNFKLHSLM
jgi:hypothetical protein